MFSISGLQKREGESVPYLYGERENNAIGERIKFGHDWFGYNVKE